MSLDSILDAEKHYSAMCEVMLAELFYSQPKGEIELSDNAKYKLIKKAVDKMTGDKDD